MLIIMASKNHSVVSQITPWMVCVVQQVVGFRTIRVQQSYSIMVCEAFTHV